MYFGRRFSDKKKNFWQAKIYGGGQLLPPATTPPSRLSAQEVDWLKAQRYSTYNRVLWWSPINIVPVIDIIMKFIITGRRL